MGWDGNMTVNVNNQTGGTIYGAICFHQWSGNTSNGGPLDLPNGGSFSFPINVGSGGSDDWSVAFIDAQGNGWYRNGKQCDVEESDYGSGGSVNINLLGSSTGFSVELPSSSSCTDNYYTSGWSMP
jgi:hypothetical protein